MSKSWKKNKMNKLNNLSKTNTSPDISPKFGYKPCHEPTEIVSNLYLCKELQVKELIKAKKVDVLVPLAEVSGSIWDWGFNGEILYYPIEDYSVLPQHILKRCVTDIISKLKTKKVALFCLGGHGRTGYIAACVLGKLGYDDPIRIVRNKYCQSAIECNEQVESIATFLNKPKLAVKYYMESTSLYGYYGYSNYGNHSNYSNYYNPYNYSKTYSPRSLYSLLEDDYSEKEEKEYGIEPECIETKLDFPEEMAKKWYSEDMIASGEEGDDWDDLDMEYRQTLYDYYRSIALGV